MSFLFFFFLSFFLQAAVFTQSVTTVKWNQDTSLEANLRRRNDDNPRAPRPIKVTFRPSKNRSYQSRFRFEVKEGEGFDLLVSGRGTYQEDTTPNPQPTVGPRMYNGESVSQSVSQETSARKSDGRCCCCCSLWCLFFSSSSLTSPTSSVYNHPPNHRLHKSQIRSRRGRAGRHLWLEEGRRSRLRALHVNKVSGLKMGFDGPNNI